MKNIKFESYEKENVKQHFSLPVRAYMREYIGGGYLLNIEIGKNIVINALFYKGCYTILTHLCPPLRSTFAVRETASLGIMGAPRVPPLNPSETIVF